MSESNYTVARAARRIGRSEATIRGWIHSGTLSVLAGTDPQLLPADEVNRRRAENLARFDDVLDLTFRGEPPSPKSSILSPSERLLVERVQALEGQLRQVVASRATTNEALQLLLRGEQGLLDAVLAGIPADLSNVAGDNRI